MRRVLLVCALALLPSAAGAFSYSEAIDGELSGDRLAPTALIGVLGSNPLSGSTVTGDLDYVHITIPDLLTLNAIVLTAVTSTDDLAFIGVQAGTTFTVTPVTATPGALLGYTHFGTGPAAGDASVGNNILDDMGDNQHEGFGSIGFIPPLNGNDYTFWIQQTGAQPFAYTLDFVVAPEPGTFALLGLGLLALAGRARSARH